MKFKDVDVNPKNVFPELMMGLLVFEGVYQEYFPAKSIVVTSINDGVHEGNTGYDSTKTPPSNSLHYQGRAVDIRAHDIPHNTAEIICSHVKQYLGRFYDLILEGEGDNYHFHLEYDPGA